MDRRIFSVCGFIGILALAGGLTGCDSAQTKLRKQGIAEYNLGEYQKAFDTFNQGLDIDQFKAIDNYYAGAAAMKLGKYERAEYHLQLAWKADPSLGQVKDALTVCLLREGQENRALDFLERDAAITAKAKKPVRDAHSNAYVIRTEEDIFRGKGIDRLRLANAYVETGDMDNAKLNYLKALEVAPESPEVHFAVGSFYERIGDKAGAGSEYTKVYQLNSDYPGIVGALARCGLQPTQ